MTADRVRVVLRRLGQVDRGLAEFLEFAVCKAQVALPEVVAFLHDTLRKKVSRQLRAAAAVALGRLRVDDAAVLADLFAFLDSGEEEGTEALCLVGPAALHGLIERLRQGSAQMRELLLRTAANLQGRNPHLADLLPGVLACLSHEDDEVRQAALGVLQGCKRRSAEGARLVEGMIWQERDCKTRRDAVVVLGRSAPTFRPRRRPWPWCRGTATRRFVQPCPGPWITWGCPRRTSWNCCERPWGTWPGTSAPQRRGEPGPWGRPRPGCWATLCVSWTGWIVRIGATGA
jgi:hypothetical protein